MQAQHNSKQHGVMYIRHRVVFIDGKDGGQTVREAGTYTHDFVKASHARVAAHVDTGVAAHTQKYIQVCEPPQKSLKNKAKMGGQRRDILRQYTVRLGQLFASPAAFITPRESLNSCY